MQGPQRHPITTTNPWLRQIFKRQEALGLSNKELERLSGVSNVYIYILRCGKTINPSIHFVSWLAEAVGLELMLKEKEKSRQENRNKP